MIIRRRVAPIAVLSFLASCETMDPNKCYEQNGETLRPCIGLEVRPLTGGDGSFMIKGDTLRMRTESDSGYLLNTWTIAGEALTATGLGTPQYSLLVLAMKTGSATVSASHDSPARAAESVIQVKDSSAITAISVYTAQVTPITMRVGDSLLVFADLADAEGHRYRLPPAWSVSDPSIATVVTLLDGLPPTSIVRNWVVGKAVGQVDVIASVLSTKGSKRLTVVPR